MTNLRTTYLAYGISVLVHLSILTSHQVRGVMFWNYGRVPKVTPTEKLVFELEAPAPPPALPPNPPKANLFVDSQSDQKDAKPKPTNLVGLKDSTAKDSASKKKVDGTPNLDGKSEAFGAHDRPDTKGPFSPGRPGAAPQPAVAKSEPSPLNRADAAPKKPAQQAPPKPPTAQIAERLKESLKDTISKLLADRPAFKPPQNPKQNPSAPRPAPNQAITKVPAPKPKDIGPDGVLPLPPSPAEPTPRQAETPPAKRAEEKPAEKPVQVAMLPPASATIVPQPAPKEEYKVPQRQALNPRVSAAMPQPFSPPPMTPEARKSTPDSSAGEKGENSFNIKQNEYAKYYKHITQRVSSTLDILYAGDISLISPRRAEAKVIIDFKILRSGDTTNVKLFYDGGDTILSSMLLSTVRGTPLDPFPRYIKEKELKIRYTFYFR